GVAVMAVAQRLHRRLDNEIGCAKIRLTDPEIDDVAALRRKLSGASQNRERVLLADAIECSNGPQHGRHLNLIASQKQTSVVILHRNMADIQGPRKKG